MICKYCAKTAIWSLRSGLIRVCNSCKARAINEMTPKKELL